jgi:hypothetical protein
VFVVFGGYVGYPSDDINKFLWMVGGRCCAAVLCCALERAQALALAPRHALAPPAGVRARWRGSAQQPVAPGAAAGRPRPACARAPQVRIGGGVYPEIKEADYLTKDGDYRIDGAGSPQMLNTLMYKLSYYQ